MTTRKSIQDGKVERWDDDDDFDFSSLSSSSVVLTRSEGDSASVTESSQGGDDSRGNESEHWRAGKAFASSAPPDFDEGRDGLDDPIDDEDEQGDTLKVSDITKETLAQLASYAKKKPAVSMTQNEEAGDDKGEDAAWDADVIIPEGFSMNSIKSRISKEDSSEFYSFGSISDTSSSSIPPLRLAPRHTAESASSINAPKVVYGAVTQRHPANSHSEKEERQNAVESYDDFDFDDGVKSGEDIAKELNARLSIKKDSRTATKRSKVGTSPQVHADNNESDSGLVITDDLDISPGRLRARSLSNKLREAAHNRRRKLDSQQGEHRPEQQRHNVSNKVEARVSQSSPVQKANERGASSPVAKRTEGKQKKESKSSPRTRDLHESQDVVQSNVAIATRPSLTSQGPQQRKDGDGGSQNRWKRGARGKTVYGDGHELDKISDLPIETRGGGPISSQGSTPFVNPSGLSPSTNKRRNRQRKKKEPYLIRNLGSSGNGSMQVGDMKWNATLRRWEGNEQEGREFENAVRGSGRPALITRLSLGSSGIAVGGRIAGLKDVSDKHSGATGGLRPSPSFTKTNLGVAHVVGDMVFDPLNLCWKRNDGAEEADPFADLERDQMDEERAAGSRSSRKVRQRTVSAEDVVIAESDIDTKSHGLGIEGDEKSIRETFSRAKGHASLPPVHLQDRITLSLWKSSFAAEERHEREMKSFAGLTRSASRRSSRQNHQSSTDHLYLIRALARQNSRGH